MQINETLKAISELVGTDPAAALNLLRKNESELNSHLEGRMNKSALLIDIGTSTKNEEVLVEGLEGLGKFLEELENEPSEKIAYLFPHALYNLANGYSTVCAMERSENDGVLSPDNEFYKQAKAYYRMGFGHESLQDEKANAKLRINYANLLSSIGRNTEAIADFEEAIKLDPNNPLGIGNLGVELTHYYRISGDPKLLIEARKLIENALEMKEEITQIGGAHVKPHYEQYIEWINKTLNAIKEKPKSNLSILQRARKIWHKLVTPKVHKTYSKMCDSHDLFLNFRTGNRGSIYVGDTIFPYTLTAGISDDITIPRLLRTVNEIKERYSIARLSLFEALHPQYNIEPYERLTYYADTLDYAAYGLRVAKVKLALENAFNVLDKIAFFLDYYLKLGIDSSQINFSSIWTETIDGKKQMKQSIYNLKNSKLFALYDLSLDLVPEGYLHHLRKNRNYSTHRYLLPHVEDLNLGTEIDGEDYHLMYEDLTRRSIRVLKLARAAVIYLIALIDEEEGKKHSEIEKYTPVIYPPYMHLNFNPEDPWNFK